MSLPALLSVLPAAWRRLAAPLVVLAFASGAALAQEADPPGRVARLGLAEGTVSIAEGDAGQWELAEPNRPLSSGDRVWTEPGARAELHVGSNALRLDGQTSLDIAQLDDQQAQLRLTQGRLSLRVRQLWDGERIEIGTPNLAVVVNQPGLYRVEVDAALGITRVAVAAGAATLYGENGASVALQAAQQLAMSGRNLSAAPGQDVARQDPFERWIAERDRGEEQSIAARYVSRETIGYQQLDGHGDWQNDANYGQVWVPRITIANWAPYRFGQWRWVAPWGWTWVDDAPWGFAPFHYGRWAQVGSRWAWVPGPRGPRPVYAPALVGFVGNPGGPGHDPHWNIGANRPGVGWFPLGPGEAWRPGYRASPRYLANVNRPGPQVPAGTPRDRFVHQHRPDAVTAVTAADFERGRPVRSHWQRVGEAELAGARLVAPPTRDFGGRFAERGVEAREPRPRMSSPAAAIGAPLAGNPTLPGVQAVPPSGGTELQPRPPHGAWAGQPRERPPMPQQQAQPQERFREQGPTAEQQAQFQRAQMERQQREQAEHAQRQQQQAQFQRAQMERQQREQADQAQRQQQQYQQQQAQREQFQRDRERQQRAEQEARTRGQAQQQNIDNGRAQRQIERAQRGQVNPSGEQYRGQGS